MTVNSLQEFDQHNSKKDCSAESTNNAYVTGILYTLQSFLLQIQFLVMKNYKNLNSSQEIMNRAIISFMPN